MRDTGLPVVIVTTRGHVGQGPQVRLMRVEHDGSDALVASKSGDSNHPAWHANLKADSHTVIKDGPEPRDFAAEEVAGDERARWWERAVAASPPYAEYQEKTERGARVSHGNEAGVQYCAKQEGVAGRRLRRQKLIAPSHGGGTNVTSRTSYPGQR